MASIPTSNITIDIQSQVIWIAYQPHTSLSTFNIRWPSVSGDKVGHIKSILWQKSIIYYCDRNPHVFSAVRSISTFISNYMDLNLKLTISRAVISRELLEVCCLKSLLVAIHCPHDWRPWLTEHLHTSNIHYLIIESHGWVNTCIQTIYILPHSRKSWLTDS